MIVNLKRLPDGRICIHWFRLDENGPIQTGGDVRQTAAGLIRLGGVRGWIACNPQQNTVAPQQRGMETFVCSHSDDPRAATCPACLDTREYTEAMAAIKAREMSKGQ